MKFWKKEKRFNLAVLKTPKTSDKCASKKSDEDMVKKLRDSLRENTTETNNFVIIDAGQHSELNCP